MTQASPRHILCAVRSRPGGEDTVKRAIALALEHKARLTFFQVIDASFLDRFSTRGSSRKIATQELQDMAAFTLSMLCEQARHRGVAEVDYLLREGDVREALLQAVAELEPDALVMGRPRPGPGSSTFESEELTAFIAELERRGVTVDNPPAP
jgi:nucleotide-binding universal stress UspA family protein